MSRQICIQLYTIYTFLGCQAWNFNNKGVRQMLLCNINLMLSTWIEIFINVNICHLENLCFELSLANLILINLSSLFILENINWSDQCICISHKHFPHYVVITSRWRQVDVFPISNIIFLLIDFNQSIILVQHSGICNIFCNGMYDRSIYKHEKGKNAWETITTSHIDTIFSIFTISSISNQ